MSCADTFLKSKLRKTSRRPQAPLRRRKLGLQSCARSSLNWLRSFQQARHVICDLHTTFCSPRLLQASHAKAEKKLQEERATLTRFDNELKELERVIKTKKQAASDAELRLKKFEHDMQTLAKEKTAATNFVANPQKQFDWMRDESECVVFLLSFWVRWMLIIECGSLFGQTGSPYDFAAERRKLGSSRTLKRE